MDKIKPEGRYVHQLFERQVTTRPDSIACLQGQQSLTFAELNDRANLLALHILERDSRKTRDIIEAIPNSVLFFSDFFNPDFRVIGRGAIPFLLEEFFRMAVLILKEFSSFGMAETSDSIKVLFI